MIPCKRLPSQASRNSHQIDTDPHSPHHSDLSPRRRASELTGMYAGTVHHSWEQPRPSTDGTRSESPRIQAPGIIKGSAASLLRCLAFAGKGLYPKSTLRGRTHPRHPDIQARCSPPFLYGASVKGMVRYVHATAVLFPFHELAASSHRCLPVRFWRWRSTKFSSRHGYRH